MALRRISNGSMDFSDGKLPSLEQHPDMDNNYIMRNGVEPGHLQRNKSERRRLQGLQRSKSTTAAGSAVTPYTPKTMREKFDMWMINEGGKRLFLIFFAILHILVIVLGFMNYDLKDNAVGARATFGITYRKSEAYFFKLVLTNDLNAKICSNCAYRCSRAPCRRGLHSASRLQKLRIAPAPHPAQLVHPL